MEEKDIIKLSRIHEEPTKEKLEEAISYLKKLTTYQKKNIYGKPIRFK